MMDRDFEKKRMEDRGDFLKRYESFRKADPDAAYERFLKSVEPEDKGWGRFRIFIYAAGLIPFLLLLSYFLIPGLFDYGEAAEKGSVAVVAPTVDLKLVRSSKSSHSTEPSEEMSSQTLSYKLDDDGVLDMREVDKQADSTAVAGLSDNYELATDRGDEFRLVLEDGTKIIMNYNSKLYYPVKFSRRQRTVRLCGEAYFEVAPDKDRPFVVQLGGVSVKQYGTVFNIRSYDSSRPEVTLLSGSVSLSMDSVPDCETKLSPGEQAVCNNGEINVAKVDTERVVSWTKGLFAFDNKSLRDIMNTLADWYGVEVVFKDDDVAKVPLTGTFDRHQSVVNILNAIENVSGVDIEFSEGRIIVYGYH